MHHSIIPEEKLFEQNNSENSMIELEFKGHKIQAHREGQDALVLDRLIETDPKAYLDPSLQPGAKVFLDKTYSPSNIKN